MLISPLIPWFETDKPPNELFRAKLMLQLQQHNFTNHAFVGQNTTSLISVDLAMVIQSPVNQRAVPSLTRLVSDYSFI